MKEQLIKTTTDVHGTLLGMAWYNFLVRFAFIASAIVNFIYCISYLTGSIYMIETNAQVTAETVYAYYGPTLRVVDILYGLFLIGFGVFTLIVRGKLANYAPDAPKCVYILYSLVAGVPFVYSILVAAITSQSITLKTVLPPIIGLVVLFLHIKYFKKRAHLFVDKTELLRHTPSNPIPTPAVNAEPQKIESITNPPYSNYELDSELGLVPNKPIYVNGTDQQWRYLLDLRSIDGEALKWNFRGSIYINEVQGLVDIYDAYLPSGDEYRTVYMNASGISCPTCAPKGFSHVSAPYMSTSTNHSSENEKPSKGKRKTTCLIVVAAIVAMLAICIAFSIPAFKYQYACNKLNNGEYDEAYLVFKDLGNYRDSKTMLDECTYQNACCKLDNEAYITAIELFECLNGYSDSLNKINQAMYGYVLKHKDSKNITTFDYLKELNKQDYKDSSHIYKTLYAWKITVMAVNSSVDDTITNKDSIRCKQPVYFHLKLTGGEPYDSARITVKLHFSSGKTMDYTFEN